MSWLATYRATRDKENIRMPVETMQEHDMVQVPQPLPHERRARRDEQVAALKSCVLALDPLVDDDRARVLRSVSELLGVDLDAV